MERKNIRTQHFLTIIPFLLIFVGMTVCQTVPYKTLYYEQYIDHFNFGQNFDKNVFQQRFLVQDKWWDGKGPIFLYTGNEGPITAFWESAGWLFDIAPQFKALVIFAEHRFYGTSLPFGPVQSFKPPYIHLLTTEQALADFATLIQHVKVTHNASTSAVIAFGGSYGGMLAGYARFKYPNLIQGSIAASAPIYMIAGQSSRDFFFQDVSKVFTDALPGCDAVVKDAFKQMYQLASQGKQGLDQITARFSLCKPLETDDDLRHLVGWVRNAFTNLAMFNYPYRVGALPAWPVRSTCSVLLASGDPLTKLAKAANVYYGNLSCHDMYSEFVECADPTGCGTGPDSLAWDYQACTEMLLPSGTNNQTDFFPVLPFTLDQRNAYCQKRWGVTPRAEWMNVYFWGRAIKSATNIVFSNGLLDPWHRGGVLEEVSPNLPVVIIKDGAHHLDLRALNLADPDSVTKARAVEKNYIQQWLEDHYRQ